MKTVTIAGGGVAGLSLGIALRRKGVPVELHEAGAYPRHRVCGEFVNGVSDETLARLGVSELFEEALRHRATDWFVGDDRIYHGELEQPALGISRHWLDRELARRFEGLGGELHEGSRQKCEPREGLVWATGRKPVKGSSWLGLKFHVRDLTDCRGLEMHLGRHGYVGLAPVESGRVNVCSLFQNRGYPGKRLGLFWSCLEESGLGGLAERLRAADPDEVSFTGVSAFSFGTHECPPGLLALGDAGSVIPPFTGNGMSMAFEAADSAVEPLVDFAGGKSSWQSVVDDVRGRLHDRFRRRLFTARILHPFLLSEIGRMLLAASARTGVLPFGPLARILR